jgi:hypothetical protein
MEGRGLMDRIETAIRLMVTGRERGGTRLRSHGLPGRDARLTPLDGDSYTFKGAVGFAILDVTVVHLS